MHYEGSYSDSGQGAMAADLLMGGSPHAAACEIGAVLLWSTFNGNLRGVLH